MADVVSAAKRSAMMSGIRGSNTALERQLRSGLHRRGFRFRLHARDLPGTPDLVLPRYEAVIFAHGCFWHGHGCRLFKWPRTRPEFWRSKILHNRAVDERAVDALRASGWRVLVIWECAIKGVFRRPIEDIVDRCEGWLRASDEPYLEVSGERQA